MNGARISAVLLCLWIPSIAHAETNFQQSNAREEINTMLDDFHDAAAKADADRYFAHFSEGAVFLGTDATERWPLKEFRAFAVPIFSEGRGWTYLSQERHISIASDGKSAWFDELLTNEGLGQCRGSGVLFKVGNVWRLAQYNLSIPIPNDLAYDFAEKIKQQSSEE